MSLMMSLLAIEIQSEESIDPIRDIGIVNDELLEKVNKNHATFLR